MGQNDHFGKKLHVIYLTNIYQKKVSFKLRCPLLSSKLNKYKNYYNVNQCNYETLALILTCFYFITVSGCILNSFTDNCTKFSVFVEKSCINELTEYYYIPDKHKNFTDSYFQSKILQILVCPPVKTNAVKCIKINGYHFRIIQT